MNDLIPPLPVLQQARGMLQLATELCEMEKFKAEFEDYWTSVSAHWDINIHDYYGDGKLRCCVYAVKVDKGGSPYTDTNKWHEVKL